jgi:hypothetical protein
MILPISSPSPGAQVHVPGHEPDVPHPRGIDRADELLQLHGPAGEPVDVIADHRITQPVRQVS